MSLLWETLRSVDSATFAGAYVAVGTPFRHPSSICKVVNNSTVLVTVSIDGTTDIDVVPAGSFFLYDARETGSPIQQGTQILVKGSAGVGLVYVVTQYNN